MFGYTNASWTLRADLVSTYFCRLINETEKSGKKIFVTKSDRKLETKPMFDFQPGYIKRAMEAGILPSQGKKEPWMVKQNYILEAIDMNFGSVKDSYMKFY